MPRTVRLLTTTLAALSAGAALVTVSGCSVVFATHQAPVESPADTVGPNPRIGPVESSLIPTVQYAPAGSWGSGEMPRAAPGMSVNAFATGLDHPRWLYVLPNGDVLVAETNSPPKPDDGKGIKGAAQKVIQGYAGAEVPTANRITLLRDTKGTGVADVRSTFLSNLNSPFGMALVGNTLYVADTDAIRAFSYKTGEIRIADVGRKVTDLPAGPINHHWTKNIIASSDGKSLYATTGSNSNVSENGAEAEVGRAAIYKVDIATGNKHLFATGLRNPNGMAWMGGMLWTVTNERDELGNDLVPDYLTSVKAGAFYGWPYSYFGQHVDMRPNPQRPDLVATAIAPDYALGAHVAALGLVAAEKTTMPAPFANGVFIGEHGSWNRKPPVGYKVVFVPFQDGKPAGRPVDVLTGFVNEEGVARGRPVGVALSSKGELLVADDVGNTVWRTTSDRR